VAAVVQWVVAVVAGEGDNLLHLIWKLYNKKG
jgi:hypothetical protein